MTRPVFMLLLCTGCELSSHALQAGFPVALERRDAGPHDAGAREPAAKRDGGLDGGHEPRLDAGEPADAGSVPGLDAGEEVCGLQNTVAHVVLTADDGWPVSWPTCSTTPGACRQLFAKRFGDQASLDTFFAQELQAVAPTVGFFGAEALVVYDCGCPTRGATLAIDAISADSCTTVVSTTLTHASEENCVVDETFSRVYAVARLPADAGATLVIANTDRVESCAP